MEKVYRATVKKPITLVAVLSHGKDIIMTDEDKKRISEYMRWTYEPDRHCIVSEGENHRRNEVIEKVNRIMEVMNRR